MCNAVIQAELSERSSLIGYSYCLATATEVQSDSRPERSKEQQTLDHIIHTCVTGALGCVCVFDLMSVHLTEKERGGILGFPG